MKRVLVRKKEDSPDLTSISGDFARMFADAATGQQPTTELPMQKDSPAANMVEYDSEGNAKSVGTMTLMIKGFGEEDRVTDKNAPQHWRMKEIAGKCDAVLQLVNNDGQLAEEHLEIGLDKGLPDCKLRRKSSCWKDILKTTRLKCRTI